MLDRPAGQDMTQPTIYSLLGQNYTEDSVFSGNTKQAHEIRQVQRKKHGRMKLFIFLSLQLFPEACQSGFV